MGDKKLADESGRNKNLSTTGRDWVPRQGANWMGKGMRGSEQGLSSKHTGGGDAVLPPGNQKKKILINGRLLKIAGMQGERKSTI